MNQLQRIISGGQTGIDQLGLDVARSLGIPTGGLAPKGYLTENGPDERLRAYGLTEHSSGNYEKRTRANVQQSDGTVIFGDVTGGTKLTLDTCIRVGKPYLVNPTADQLRTWLIDHPIRVLNVAGSRGSGLSAEQLAQYRKVLMDALH
ncbi:YpsA SLOG family protein [Spirosoma jeollabukense]